MIYLDNSATTIFKPQPVVEAVADCLTMASGNPTRSGHKEAIKASMLVLNARRSLASFLGCLEERVIFTSGCTASLNLAILGNIRQGHIIATCLEHNSVLRPLYELERLGRISLTIVPPNEEGIVTPAIIKNAMQDNTYMVCVNHVSNVTGAVNPVADIGKMLSKTRVMFLVDGAQSVGYQPMNIADFGIDMLAIAPHKGLHAPQGIGALLLGERVESLCPIIFGGTGTSSESVLQPNSIPEGFESGTIATPLIAGLASAIDFTEKNQKNVPKIKDLTARLYNGLGKIKGVTVYSPKNCFGVVSFNVADLSSPEVCDVLDNNYDIAVRGGLHCAPLMHKHLNTTSQGAVRASLSTENTEQDISALLSALRELT